MFESLPSALVPTLAGMSLSGSFALRAALRLDTRRPDQMLVDWDLGNRCRIVNVPAEIGIGRFSQPFRRTRIGFIR